MLNKVFKLKENNTTIRTEVIAGITTFVTMAYILAVNPDILADGTGMNDAAILIATAISSFVGSLLMALLANYPFALAPGLGLNAYFAYVVVGTMGVSWETALLAVFFEGIIFILLSVTNVREAIFNAIPKNLKLAVSAGLGLFITIIGLTNAKVTVTGSTILKIRDFTVNVNSETVGAILALIGVIITAILLVKNIKGGILLGILITWVLGIIAELAGIYVPAPELEMYSVIPSDFITFDFSSFGETFGKVFTSANFSEIKILDFIVVIFAFLFVDLFDTLGTLIGVSTKANMLDEDGKLPKIKGALLADAIATSIGAVCGTSTTTTFVESAAGVTEGGRTGLTALTTGFLFLISVIFAPLFLTIPSFATAPALIIVGFYMIGNIVKIDFEDMTEGIPAFLCIIAMPFLYSISEGISFGVISYAIINLVTGSYKKKKISIIIYILAVLFLLKYFFIN